MNKARLIDKGNHVEVHYGSTYRIVFPSRESLATLVTTLRHMRMPDTEIGRVLVELSGYPR